MNKTEFVFELVQAGYFKEQCDDIEEIIEWAIDRIPCHISDIRYAAHQYLIVCTDIQKLRNFLSLVNEMNRNYAISWEDAVSFVLKVVCGWCR